MTRTLTMHRRDAAGGATALCVFVHGYGADGRDLLGLADVLGPHLPGVAFAAPDAPTPSSMNPAGFQWAPIPWLDGSDMAAAEAAFAASARDLDAACDRLLDELGLAPGRLVLFGFSQGCMQSLHMGPRRAAAIGGIVGISGRLMVPERLPTEVCSRPPVLLIHGDRDDVVPFASLGLAEAALRAEGFDVATHVMRGTAHGIAPDGLSAALSFLRDRLAI